MRSTLRRRAPGCLIAALAFAATPLTGQTLAQLYQHAGRDVARTPDLDGDGGADFVVATLQELLWLRGRDGTLLHRFVGFAHLPRWPVDDLDGDGKVDLVTGVAQRAVTVYSGATGATMHTIPLPNNAFRVTVMGRPDADGDGRPDFGFGYVTGPGATFEMRSGADGSLINQFSVSYPGCSGVDDIVPLGDVDGDGVMDVAVDVYQLGGFCTTRSESVFVLSGRTGAVLRTHAGEAIGVGQLRTDLNGDGHADYLVFSHIVQRLQPREHVVQAISGGDGGVLFSIADYQDATSAGDFDGDGVEDVFARFAAGGAELTVLSGRTGAALARVTWRNRAPILFGLDDLDGDGSTELAVYDDPPFVVYSGAPPDFYGSSNVASVAAPVTQQLRLHAPGSEAGKTYVILGSLAGTTPGTTIGGVTIPLNVDAYTLLVAASPSALITAGVGVLPASASVTANLRLPPLPPAAAGLTLHHAAVVFDAPGLPAYASRSASLVLVP